MFELIDTNLGHLVDVLQILLLQSHNLEHSLRSINNAEVCQVMEDQCVKYGDEAELLFILYRHLYEVEG